MKSENSHSPEETGNMITECNYSGLDSGTTQQNALVKTSYWNLDSSE